MSSVELLPLFCGDWHSRDRWERSEIWSLDAGFPSLWQPWGRTVLVKPRLRISCLGFSSGPSQASCRKLLAIERFISCDHIGQTFCVIWLKETESKCHSVNSACSPNVRQFVRHPLYAFETYDNKWVIAGETNEHIKNEGNVLIWCTQRKTILSTVCIFIRLRNKLKLPTVNE